MSKRYYPVTYSQEPEKPQSNLPWLVIGIACFLLFQFLNNSWPFNGNSNQPRPDDNQEQVEPDDKDQTPKPAIDKPEAKDTYIVRVYETQADQAPVWLIKQIQNDKFWHGWVKSDKGMALETVDPDNEQAKSFVAAAKKRGVDPPFWMHGHEGTVLSVTPFSETLAEDDWKKIILKSVK